jgi:large subunit ribosomal protein L18
MGKREKKVIRGTAARPRLLVFRSHKHIYVQIIDDSVAQTITSCSTLEPHIQTQLKSTSNINASLLVGETIGKRLVEKNIKSVIFDRNGKPYHGRIKAVAEGARNSGLDF